MSNLEEMTQKDWQVRTDAALDWLHRSILATGNKGSAHSWHPLLGWSRAYPETTGYLIETLLQYARLKQDPVLEKCAIDCAAWLDTVQLPSGAFPGLLTGNTNPSVFNTSQILFATPYLKEASRALEWLLSLLESDGAWRQFAFVRGFVPSYYTRAVWGVLKANETLQNQAVEGLMRYALHFYSHRFLPNGAVKDWGFKAGAPAFTHTIAYTLEGFWECAIALNEPEIEAKTLHSLERLLSLRALVGGRTAGRYDEYWKGDYSFVCVTGNCQLSVLCHKVWARTGAEAFREAADSFLSEILGAQRFGANKNRFGALPGSIPFSGAYLPFRYPNWAAKFYLDAMHCLSLRHERYQS